MSISNNDKDKARDYIEAKHSNGVSWDDLKKVNFHPFSKFVPQEGIERFNDFAETLPYLNSATYEEWQDLVSGEQATLDSASLESENFGNKNVASNVFIPTAESSAWVQYTKKLYGKSWSNGAVDGIKNSAFSILQHLSTDTTETGPVKGLVLGNVQSGKTANMAGLMAMAADNGWNYVIVLTGMIENLRLQNQKRLINDLSGNSTVQFEPIENPSLSSQRQISELNLTANKVYLTVGLKNSTRLKNLVKWLYSDANRARQLKLLIIDDEADQASVNVKKINDETEEEVQERTAVNKAILDLVHGIKNIQPKASNYIAYTATPYANVLNEAGKNTLYPSDFIYSLTPSPDYIGPQQLFGTEEPEQQAALNIVRDIKQPEEEIIKQLNDGDGVEIPESMKRAIDWFLIATSTMRVRFIEGKMSPRPVSMLIHTSQKVTAHATVAKAVENYLLQIRKDPNWIIKAESMYRTEKNAFPLSSFIHEMSGYTVPKSVIADYPEWDSVKEQLQYYTELDEAEYLSFAKLDEDKSISVVNGFTMAIDNASVRSNRTEHVRLAYPTDTNDITPVIVIGGATLSRGLTLEGLISTYFVRTTKTADTLMQMGRWFGFRVGYEVFPRIWLTADAFHRFEFISQMDADLREEIKKYTAILKPSEIGPKIKNSPNHRFVEITANNKQQMATETDLDFQGISKQTIIFEKRNEAILRNNIELTESLISKLDSNVREVKTKNRKALSALVWRDVSFDVVKPFLHGYKAAARDMFFSNLDALIQWYEESFLQKGKATKWNIIIPTVSGNGANWNVKGRELRKVNRSQFGPEENGVISISSLRSAGDIGLDYQLDENVSKSWKDVLKAREENGFGDNPQLIIYRIDKNSTYKGEDQANRHALEANDDLIGINISIPGNTAEESLGKSIQIRIPKDSYELGEED